jgi:hypothetical protein
LRALIETLCDDLGTRVSAALNDEGDVVVRVGAAISARHRIMSRWREASPHAAELLGETAGRTAPELAALDSLLETQVASALAQAGIARSLPLARLLLAAAEGLARHASSISEVGPAIRLLSERLLRPELG